MANTHLFKYWLPIVALLVMYLEVGLGEDELIDLKDLPQSNYTVEVKLETPSSFVGWYKMTDGFLSLVHSKSDETIGLVLEYAKGKVFEWPGSFYQILKLQHAVFACIVLGFVFAAIMVATWLIFLCCRMCGKCGGKRVQVISSTTSSWRRLYIASLLGLVALLLPPIIISFTINESLNTSYKETERTVFSSLHDAMTFVNTTEQQVSFLTRKGVSTVVEGVTEEINGVENFIRQKMKGLDMTSKMKETEAVLSAWHSIPDKVKNASEVNEEIEEAVQSISKNFEAFRETLISALQTCGQICSEIDASVFMLNKNVIFSKGEITEVVENINNSLQSLNKEDFKNFLSEVVNFMGSIPKDLALKTYNIRQDVIKDLNLYAMEILNKEELKKFENFTNLARKNLQKMQQVAEENLPYACSLDRNRWYGGLVLCLIMTVVAVGLSAGLFCGICGHQNNKQATKRTTMSNAGGLTLMFTAYWMLLFSGLLMLFTTLLFTAGGMIEVYICKPAFESNFTTLDEVMDTFLQRGELNGSLIQNLKPSVALRTCADANGTVYDAFNLEFLNITSMLTYQERLKLEQRKEQLQNIEKPKPVFFNDKFNKAFRDLTEALSINTNVIDKLKGGLLKDGFESQIQLISESSDERVKALANTSIKIGEDVKQLEGKRIGSAGFFEEVEDIKKKVLGVEKTFRGLEKMLPDIIGQMYNKGIEEFIGKLIKYSDSVIKIIAESFETKLAPCRPLWNIFDSLRTVACKFTIQPLNGMWFATGWTFFFFIPTIIVSTKLSKHFLKMKSVLTEEREEKSPYELEIMNGYQTKPDSSSYHF